ncbi:hypothetical protein SGO26_04885 [Cupriavidus metallidurans]|uniref:hypothetical protein n=2 Tax=Burkholderiaceae TaxID=119060 RepID=UPI0002A43A53|nr:MULTISPECIES: hypothetical protein [unclassified Cupriavidus]EKZ96935.1 hypothetical protein D769_22728 [Cupriavidus sp. HMR-1]GMG89313.1 hypothetical protein Cmtc_05330 [Cupriavidus sp. TKC]HBD32947.1 hypothetical protein [Cupriavidus sp.]HBO81266.1 hypothetical protein [Cupriavidus sp.]
MSVDAREMLHFAADIAGAAMGEVAYRSSISRSYYAAYHAAYAWHTALPVPGSAGSRRTGRHETLVNQLYQPGVKRSHFAYWQSIALARMLNRNRLLRVEADYYVDAVVERGKMMEALANSTAIVERCT